MRTGDGGADGAVGGDEGLGMGDAAEGADAGADPIAAEVGVRGVGNGGETGDEGGVLRGDVGGFADVVREVVEFAGRQVEFPRTVAHRFEEQSTVIEKRIARWGGGRTGEHRENIHAINFSIGRQGSAGERGEREGVRAQQNEQRRA